MPSNAEWVAKLSRASSPGAHRGCLPCLEPQKAAADIPQEYAKASRLAASSSGSVNCETRYLWRAVDQEGEVLESQVIEARDKSAALRFFEKTLNRHKSPAAIVADGLKSHPAAMRDIDVLEAP